jgi:hypothetical protein
MYPLMENHEFAIEMQKGFIKDIETIDPKYIIYVNVPYSWLRLLDSHEEIFQWFDDYLKRNRHRLVGVVELFENEAIYHFEPNVKWPVLSENWITIFERI